MLDAPTSSPLPPATTNFITEAKTLLQNLCSVLITPNESERSLLLNKLNQAFKCPEEAELKGLIIQLELACSVARARSINIEVFKNITIGEGGSFYAGDVTIGGIDISDIKAVLENAILSQENLKQVFGTLPPINDETFVERPELFAQISQQFNESNAKDEQKRVLLSTYGLGGVGKTQMALYYIHNPSQAYSFKHWFQADTIEQLASEYQQLGQRLKIVDKDTSLADTIMIVKNWFETHPDWLLVYDNVQDYEKIQEYLPNKGGHILITTRNASWTLPGTIPVNVMSEKVSLELLQKISKRDDAEMAELAKELGYLPLALAQAAAYIRQKKKTTKQYLELYRKRKAQMLADKTLPTGCKHEPVYVTWDMNIAEIQQECSNAIKVINACAWLAPNNIPWPLLIRCLEIEDETDAELAFDDVKQVLSNYSLCNINEDTKTLSMHQLVQTVRQHKLTLKEQEASIKFIIRNLMTDYPHDTNVQLDAYKRLLLPHLESVLSHAFVLSQCSGVDLSREIYPLLSCLGIANLYLIGDQVRAKELLETELGIVIQLYGNEHVVVARALENLAIAYRALGNTQQEEKLLKRVLDIKKLFYNLDHPEIARTLVNLASLYSTLGKVQKAKKLLKRALAINKQHYGSNHLNVAITLMNLANVYGALGDAKKQKRLLEHVLVVKEHYYGASHPEVAGILVSLGDAYDILGNSQEAKKLFERALFIFERHYGLDHTEVAGTLVNLANAYGSLGDVQEKKKLLERALIIEEKYYGPNHIETATLLANLASAYGGLGDAQKEKELFERVLPTFEQHYGANHVKVARVWVNLADAYGVLGDAKEQKRLLERALIVEEKYYGPNHIEVAGTLVNLASAYSALGDMQKRKELLEGALPIYEQHYGANHVRVARVWVNLADAYGVLGDAKEAKKRIESALPIIEQYYGASHPKVADTLVSLANAYGTLGDLQEAKKLFERALFMFEKHYESDHARMTGALVGLAIVYDKLGDVQKKKGLLESALIINEKYNGPNHIEVARILVSLGNAYDAIGDSQGAKKLLERALPIYELHYGANHSEVARVRVSLADVYGHLGDAQEQKKFIECALPMLEQYYGASHPIVAGTLVSLANAYGALEDFQEVKKLLKRALPIEKKHYGSTHPEMAKVLALLALAHIMLNNYQKAVLLAKQAYNIVKIYPDYGTSHPLVRHIRNIKRITYTNLGHHCFSLSQLDGAIENYEKSIKINADLPDAYPNLACCYHIKGEIDRARAAFEKAIAMNPNSGIYTEYGHFLFEQQEYAEAVKKLEQAIVLSADNQRLSYGKLEYPVVCEDIRQEIDKSSSHEISIKAQWLAYYLLIQCYEKLQRPEEANESFSAFSKAVNESNSSIAYRLLGYTCQRLNDIRTAEKYFKVAEIFEKEAAQEKSTKETLSALATQSQETPDTNANDEDEELATAIALSLQVSEKPNVSLANLVIGQSVIFNNQENIQTSNTQSVEAPTGDLEYDADIEEAMKLSLQLGV